MKIRSLSNIVFLSVALLTMSSCKVYNVEKDLRNTTPLSRKLPLQLDVSLEDIEIRASELGNTNSQFANLTNRAIEQTNRNYDWLVYECDNNIRDTTLAPHGRIHFNIVDYRKRSGTGFWFLISVSYALHHKHPRISGREL